MTRATALLLIGGVLAAPAAAQFPTTPPATGAAPAVTPPSVVTRTLDNGLKVSYVRMPEVPVVQASLLLLSAGSTQDPTAQPGLAGFTASMLDEGAAGKTALQVADALELLGASFSASAGWDATQVNLYVLKKNFPAALGVMSDVVLRPDFPAREFDRLRNEQVVALQRGRDEPTIIAANAFQSLVFGAAHPYGRFPTIQAMQSLTRDQVAAFHAAAYRPERATLLVVGDVDPAEMHPTIERAFGAWRATAAAPAAASGARAPNVATTTIYLVDKPSAAQSEIRIVHPGVARNTPDFYALQVLNTILGGSFTSRLNTNLREVHGWSYGARSGFSMRAEPGPFTAQAAVVTAKTDSALIEFFRELNRIRTEPIPAEDLEKAKRYVALGFPASLETTQDVAGQLSQLVTYGIDPAFFGTFVQNIMAVTAADVQRVANQHVRPGASVVVVVGDRSTIEAGIRAANLGNVEIRQVDEFVR